MTAWSRFPRRGAVAALAAASLLGACGGQPWPSASAPRGTAAKKALLESVRTTAAAKSARLSMKIAMSGFESESASDVGITADGVADFVSGDMQMKVQLTGDAAEMFKGGLELRVVDGVMYLRLPSALSGQLGVPEGGGWLKFDASEFGGDSNPLGMFGGESDPTKFLAYLETVSNGVHAVGPAVIRGVETTHYRASLDLGKAVKRADVPPELRDQLEELLQSKGVADIEIPADVWVDTEGLVRRLVLQLDLATFAGGDGANGGGAFGGGAPTVTVAIDLYDFGIPTDVQAPPPDEIVPMPNLGGFGPSDASPAA